MRLIGPQTNQVQSLGRHQSGLTAEAGKAEAIGIVTEGVSNALGSLAGASEDILETNTRRQQQQGDLRNQKVEAEFWEPIGGREFFDVSEIEKTHPDLVTDSMKVKGRVLAAEIVPQMYQEFMSEQIKQSSLIIENDNMRNEWLARTNETFLGRQQQIQSQANSTIERQIFIDQKINFNNAMDIDRPDVALRVTQEMKGNPKIVEPLQDEARKGTETVRYKRYMLDRDFERIQDSITFLEQDVPDYEEANGQLNYKERLAWISKLNGYLNQEKALGKAKVSANIRLLKREALMTKNNTNNGIAPDPEAELDLLNRMIQMEEYDPGSMNVEIADQILSLRSNGYISKNLLSNRYDRKENILAMKNNDSIPEFEKNDIVLNMEKSDAAQTSMENTNAMKAAANAGFFGDEGLVPIDFNAPAEDLVDALVKRSNQFDQMQANYGEGLGQGIFDNDNVISHASVINMKSAQDKAEIFAAVNEEFGTNSIDIYKQLGTEGSAKSFAVAGSIAATNPAMAEMILIGEEYAQDPQRDLSYVRTQFMLKANDYIGNAYGGDFEWGTANLEASFYAYVGLAKDTTKLDQVDSASGYLWFDKGFFEQSIEGTTLGIVEHNGVKSQSPMIGVDQDKFETWSKGLDPAFLAAGGLSPDKAQLVADQVRQDKSTLIPRKKGEFVIKNSDGTYVGVDMGTPNERTFILKYDPDMPIIVKQYSYEDARRRATGK